MGCAQPGMISSVFVCTSFILNNTSYKLKSNICVTHLGKMGGKKSAAVAKTTVRLMCFRVFAEILEAMNQG